METSNSSPVNIDPVNMDESGDSDVSIKEIGPDGPKKRKLKSWVWDHFTFLKRKKGEPLLAKCNKCGQKYSGESNYGTGNLKRHLEKCLKARKEFDEFESVEYATSAQKSQLELYLAEPRSNRTSTIQILELWKSQQYRYPELARLARDVLCVPISTVASESAFSTGGRVLDQFRSVLSPQTVEALICTKDWLFGEKDMSKALPDEMTQNILATNINQYVNQSEIQGGRASNDATQMWSTS